MRYSNVVALFECCCHSVLEFYKGAASECVAQGVVLYRAPDAPWLLHFASSCEGKGNNECKSHAPMGHRSEDEAEFRMQRCHEGHRSEAAGAQAGVHLRELRGVEEQLVEVPDVQHQRVRKNQ